MCVYTRSSTLTTSRATARKLVFRVGAQFSLQNVLHVCIHTYIHAYTNIIYIYISLHDTFLIIH